MRCARCDYCGCTRKRLTLPYTQKTETSASGSARTTGSWAWRGRLTWKLSSGIADRRPARRLAAQTALEETIVVLVRYYNPLRDDDKPWHWAAGPALSNAQHQHDGPRLADADGHGSSPGPAAARSVAAAASSGLDNHVARPRRCVVGGMPRSHRGSIPHLPVALELQSHSVRRACVRHGHVPPVQFGASDRIITMRAPAAASLASILTRRQHSWRPHGVSAAGGWHAGAVRGWRGGIPKSPIASLRRRASAVAATPGLLWGGGGRAARPAARAAANGFDHLARRPHMFPYY